jgi:hypothetical protein
MSFSRDLWKVICPPNFKPSVIDKYDSSTNPAMWLEVNQLAIDAVGGDSYVMANYLPIVLHQNLTDGASNWLGPVIIRSLQTVCQ